MNRLGQASLKRSGMRNDPLPALHLVRLPIDDLRMPARAVRKLDPAHIDEVAGSISALGFCVPVLIGKDNHILDGGARIQAARLLGLGYAPCLRIDHLTDDEQRLLRLAVNRLGEKGQWNLDELKIEFEELILAGAPIEITGFEIQEIDGRCHANRIWPTKIGKPDSGSDRSGGSPRPERFVSEDAKRAAGCEMALDVECVVDGGVNGQETLGGSGRFETLHLALAPSCRLMRILGPVVCAQALVMTSRQSNFGLRRGVRAQFIRYQHLGCKALFLEQLAHQFHGCGLVAAS
jgi:hypothetical protein